MNATDQEEDGSENVLSNEFRNRLEDVLKDLHVLAALSQGQKLRTQNRITGLDLERQHATMIQGIVRFWNGESRFSNIERVRELYNEGFHLLERAISWWESANLDENDQTSRKRTIERVTVKQYIVRLWNALHKGENGLDQLYTTYNEDPKTSANIELLKESITSNFQRSWVSVSFLRNPQAVKVELPNDAHPNANNGENYDDKLGSKERTIIKSSPSTLYPTWMRFVPGNETIGPNKNGKVVDDDDELP